MFLNFLSQIVTNFCSKKTNLKNKIVFTKTNLEKTFFIKNKLENIFWGTKIWKYFFPCFHEGGNYQGGQLSGKFGYVSFYFYEQIINVNPKTIATVL